MQNSYIYRKSKEYIQQIMPLIVMRSIDEKWKPAIIDTVTDIQDEIIKHCVMLILYVWYREFSEKHSIRFYIKNNICLDNNSTSQLVTELGEWINNTLSYSIERENKEYDDAIYKYKTFRTEKDKFAKSFFRNTITDFEGLYNFFDDNEKGERLNKLNGQELSYQSFLELLFIKKYSIVALIRRGKFSESKNLSHIDFEFDYLSQIKDKNSGIYYDMQFSKLCKDAGAFIRTLNLFALEVNCHFERNYHIAKALSSVKISKDAKEKEKNIFAHINYFQDSDHRYQDYIVLGYDKILARYDYKNVDAADIYDIVHCCNYIIRKVINMISADLTTENIDERKLYIKEVDALINFFDDFIGRGQHIIEKNIEEIKIKDFRDLYRQINY